MTSSKITVFIARQKDINELPSGVIRWRYLIGKPNPNDPDDIVKLYTEMEAYFGVDNICSLELTSQEMDAFKSLPKKTYAKYFEFLTNDQKNLRKKVHEIFS